MGFVIAAIAIVGVLCLLDLLLTFGVIRRLREQTDIINVVNAGRARGTTLGMAPGEAPAAFSAATTEGAMVSGPAGLRLVAFFSRCSICPERVAPFADYLTANRIDRDSVLVVSVGPGGEPQPYLSALAPVARICVEPDGGQIVKAFELSGFPAFFLLDAAGAVAATEFDPDELPVPARA
jgi:hypothetical protein